MRPLASAAATTDPAIDGWLSRSASVFQPRGTWTPNQRGILARAPPTRLWICAERLRSVVKAVAAGAQSVMAMVAWTTCRSATASARAMEAVTSAAGIDRADVVGLSTRALR